MSRISIVRHNDYNTRADRNRIHIHVTTHAADLGNGVSHLARTVVLHFNTDKHRGYLSLDEPEIDDLIEKLKQLKES